MKYFVGFIAGAILNQAANEIYFLYRFGPVRHGTYSGCNMINIGYAFAMIKVPKYLENIVQPEPWAIKQLNRMTKSKGVK